MTMQATTKTPTLNIEAKLADEVARRRAKEEARRAAQAPAVTPETLELDCERLLRLAREKTQQRQEFYRWLDTQPQTVACARHKRPCRMDKQKSWSLTVQQGRKLINYAPCDICASEFNSKWLLAAGVPEILLDASLDNWKARTNEDHRALKDVREYAEIAAGFLILFGNPGIGKSHLAVGVLRLQTRGMFRTQDQLLRALRSGYQKSNSQSEDIIEKCKRTPLLVIDELGLSSGGRDELPMIHEILNHRYSDRMKTILTGNVAERDFDLIIGPRMLDRLREATYRIITLAGESWRPARRGNYLKDD